MVASKSQMRPLRTEIHIRESCECHDQRKLPPHLLPEDACQTKGTAYFEVHAEQANEHDDK
jgi:hypothetical protein